MSLGLPLIFKVCLFFILLTLVSSNSSFFSQQKDSLTESTSQIAIAVHGGAGSYSRAKMTAEDELKIKIGIFKALKAGYQKLQENKGQSHMEATKAAIIEFENNPLFNAGKGGKITQNFQVELDASIMDGSTLKAGAVAGVRTIKNPIKAAELVMKTTPHIMLISNEADRFAEAHQLEKVENSYFMTRERIEEWIEYHDQVKSVSFNTEEQWMESNLLSLEKSKTAFDTDYLDYIKLLKKYTLEDKQKDIPINLKGTTGAIALDKHGNLSAATSTGGTTYKLDGRVGDSPLIGAGTYANNESVAVSCTGTGEEMMKRSTAFDVHARMLYKNISLKESTEEIMRGFVSDQGGFISLDKKGNIEMPYNSKGMARGYVREDGKAYIAIFREGEDLTSVWYDINNNYD
mmetsp:Transcript_19503/g.20286  ORF Transcript_19503/g.20286 Transcript_19503/m.20286 type:complete len:404 (+) Transcript_19503:18-1229(+)